MNKLLAFLALAVAAPSAWAATCTVTEFARLPTDLSGRLLQVAPLTASTPSQAIANYTTSQKLLAPLADDTRFVYIYCDAEARIASGDSTVEANAGSLGLPAGGSIFLAIPELRAQTPTAPVVARYIAVYDGVTP